MKSIISIFALFAFLNSAAQNFKITGIVRDSGTSEILQGASILLYKSGYASGGITNQEGRFSINCSERPDSVIFSMVGYKSKRYRRTELREGDIDVILSVQSAGLQEVTVSPILAIDIVRKAARKLRSYIPTDDFESKAFYREIIHDTSVYYSVAEAIFDAQFSIRKKLCTLRMEKGRSKEDVAYTTLFEDFHPGGGPEDAVDQSLVVKQPDFLIEDRFKYYNYKLDSTIFYDGDLFYVVSFDQKSGIKEALEKGYMYISENDYSIIKFEAANSPAGTPYIKSLKGSDKIFAEILHIDLAIRGWSRTVTYNRIGPGLYLSYARMNYFIDYKQPKKGLDLHLMINTELVVTDFTRPVFKAINKDEEWKRKNLVANLPTDFDQSFWGKGNILDPTAEVKNIIGSISHENTEATTQDIAGWEFYNKDFFVFNKRSDSLTLVPIMKCNWEDKETGGMIYKIVNGNFVLETKISIRKRSNTTLKPDNGYQQGGIIVRSAEGNEENSLIFSMGTGGSNVPKYFLKRTTVGKTKTSAERADDLNGWLRIEKKDNILHVFKKQVASGEWTDAGTYQYEWLKKDLQVGLSIMSRFAGDGPKQRPDMQAVFTNIQFRNE
jgi:CarboxypepD_reg-like domain